MRTAAGIRSLGRAVPRHRFDAAEAAHAWGLGKPRDVEEIATPGFDEDAITLGVEAAKRALRAARFDAEDLGLIAIASTRIDGDATIIAEALGATHARLVETTGPTSLGLGALTTAYDAVSATNAPAIAIASDVSWAAPGSTREAREGAAAVAFLITPEGGVRIAGREARVSDPARRDHVDATGYLHGPDTRIHNDADLADAVEMLAHEKHEFIASASNVPGPGGKPLTSRSLNVSPRAVIGDAGAADAALHLAEALAVAQAGARGLAVEARGGATLALAIEVDRAPAGAETIAVEKARARPLAYLAALQARGAFLPGAQIPEMPMGAYVPLPEYADALAARYRLEAAQCTQCEQLMYPPRTACSNCAGRAFADIELSGHGTLETFTAIGRGGAPSEFAAEQAMTGAYLVGLVRFDEGPALLARIADADEAQLEIGMRVEPAFRRLFRQEGIWRYGLKFRPSE